MAGIPSKRGRPKDGRGLLHPSHPYELNPKPLSPPPREPEETREHDQEEAIEEYSALPAPVGVSDNWAEPAASSVPAGFGAVDGFEAAGVNILCVGRGLAISGRRPHQHNGCRL